eukprot:TRINITY_DN44144_c0_g1_i1.p1 TRINITY_DN44144_c0_g1~~TRINITY_DN44144_c0_g1_i1.p1  ORF type:complete len:221 (+),score=49.41 TRINITY_DN44144_c0_g1_i1:98-664(+)
MFIRDRYHRWVFFFFFFFFFYLRRTYESAFSNAVDAKLHRYSLEKCEETITEVAELFCTSHDNGEYPRTGDESIREHLWEVPSEPMPTEIDTCGRGILDVKKEYKFVMPHKEDKKIKKTTLSRSSVNRFIKRMLPTKKEENSIIPYLSLIHISEPTRPLYISYAVFCLKKKKIKVYTTKALTQSQMSL